MIKIEFKTHELIVKDQIITTNYVRAESQILGLVALIFQDGYSTIVDHAGIHDEESMVLPLDWEEEYMKLGELAGTSYEDLLKLRSETNVT